MAAQYSVQFGP
jgi:hypothetical protein